jgi:hypothetical protein
VDQDVKYPISNIDIPEKTSEIKKEVISTDDAIDIFGSQPVELVKNVTSVNSGNNSLDSNKFISELKNIGAK